MKSSAKFVAFTGILAALAVVLSLLENLLPPVPGMPPGAKLGLSNIVSMYAAGCVGFLPAMAVVRSPMSEKVTVALPAAPAGTASRDTAMQTDSSHAVIRFLIVSLPLIPPAGLPQAGDWRPSPPDRRSS